MIGVYPEIINLLHYRSLMEEYKQPVILIKAIKELNIGMGAAVAFLQEKGFAAEKSPMFKLDEQMVMALREAFGNGEKPRSLGNLPVNREAVLLRSVPKTFTHLGRVNKYLPDQGFGFLRELHRSGNEFSGTGDLFFHVRSSASMPIEQGIYAYTLQPSKKHPGKSEATGLAALNDISDLVLLFKFYTVYWEERVREKMLSLCTHGDLANLSYQVTAIADNILKTITVSLQRALSTLFELLELIPDLGVSTKQNITQKLISSDLAGHRMALLFGNKYLDSKELVKHESEIAELRIRLDAKEQQNVMRMLQPITRIKLSGLSEIALDDQVKILMALLDVPGEDKIANFASVEPMLEISSRSAFLLWVYGFTLDRPEIDFQELRSFDPSTVIRMLSKFSFDDYVVSFPYRKIKDTQSYMLLGMYLQSSDKKDSLLDTLLSIGLTFSDEYYLKALQDGNRLPIDFPRLRRLITDEDIGGYGKLISRLGWQASVELFSGAIDANQLVSLRMIIQSSGDFDRPDILELYKLHTFSIETAVELWFERLADMVNEHAFALYFLIAEQAQSERVYSRVEHKKDFLQRVFEVFVRKERANTAKSARRLLEKLAALDEKNYTKYLEKVLLKSNSLTHLELWLADYHHEFDMERYKPYFIVLGKQGQIEFLKKCIWQLRNDTAKFSASDLFALRKLTIDTDIAAQTQAPSQVDISIYVVLQLLQDLQVGSITEPVVIYQIVADNIQDVRQLLSIDGFFDRCRGRLSVDYEAIVEEGEPYPLKSSRGGIPEHLKYCEGRKAKLKGTQTPAICEHTAREFWWCRNVKCYQNCIDDHSEWKDFTILDFCDTLAIPLLQDDYDTLLGYINKINRYLAHMNCRECKRILSPTVKPEGNSNYGFYRVSSFACTASDCKAHGKTIYLSHCANGHCSGIIDQRDCVKCIPQASGYGKSGWYICNDCLACCNTRNIDRRKYIMAKTRQAYYGHDEGHLDLGIVCCPKSGHELIRGGEGNADYKRVLDWLIRNRNKSSGILKYGKRGTDGRYWFILRAEGNSDLEVFRQTIRRYATYGFNVPDLEENRSSYMVSEPFLGQVISMVFKCPSCDYVLDLSEDYHQLARMRRYHINLNISKQYSQS